MATKSILSNVTIRTSIDSSKFIRSLEYAEKKSKDKKVVFTKKCDELKKEQIKEIFDADDRRV